MGSSIAEITTLAVATVIILGAISWSLWPVYFGESAETIKPEYDESLKGVAGIPKGNDSLADHFLPPPAYDLVCVQGNPDGRPMLGDRVPFPATYLMIGRDETCDITIEKANGVSRHHASITFKNGTLNLNDMNSSNGTWINQQRIDSCELDLNVPFEIGPCTFVVVESDAEPMVNVLTDEPPDTLSVGDSEIKEHIFAIAEKLDLNIVGQLGEGGAASVFKCQKGDDIVALKVLHNREPYFLKKFFDEVVAMEKLGHHPNVVKILGSGEEIGYPYILMECMDRGSVKDRLVEKGKLAADECVQIVGSVCQALDYAHANGIIHRDIKPENILINAAEQTKLADFGIAKLTATGTKTQVGVIIGTPDYLSYEQARSMSVTPASDQYSLAIVMFEMLTGSLPFQGNPYEVITQHIDSIPPSPRIYNAEVSQEHEFALLTALSKQQERRYPSILDFAKAIGYETQQHQAEDDFREKRIYPIAAPFIVGVEGFSQVEKISMNTPSLILGRAMLPDRPAHVSGTHAEIQKIGPAFFIRDMGSKNGTYVNRVLVEDGEWMQLEHGCYINLGSTMLQFNLY